jgi:hypothetical protein
MSIRLRGTAAFGPLVALSFGVSLFMAACGGEGDGLPPVEGIEVRDVGFMTPESVLADTVADVYFVSNINGNPLEEDDNGFISRLTPEGTVENLKWADGASPDVTLNAPKGMAIRGDTLFVADIKCIRMFVRTTGAYQGDMCLEGTTFLNDLAVGPDGASLFVTDSGLQPGAAGLEPSGTDAVYRIALEKGRQGATLAKDPELGRPNGIAIGSRGIFIVTFGSGELLRYTAEGDKTIVMGQSNRQLDGIVFTNDGGFLFSAWGDSSVYRVSAGGQVERWATGLEAPADIGYDPKRNRVLIPLFNQNAVVIRDVM